MPWRPMPPCSVPGCGQRSTGNGRCAAHEAERRRQYAQRPRPSSAARGYGSKWQTIRRGHLAAHPYCSCGAQATHVDHRVSLARGGTNDASNLQSMCVTCHNRKTNAVDGGGWRRA